MAHVVRVGVVVCTPIPFVQTRDGRLVHDTISPLWHRHRVNLSWPTNFNVVEMYADGMEVGAARNSTILKALEMDPQPEFVFFLDYDVLPASDAVTKLIYRARHFPDFDIFAGVYCNKWSNPPEPLVYKGQGGGAYWDWTIGDLLTDGISGVHMGCTLVRTSAFKNIPNTPDDPWFKTVNETKMEDGLLKLSRGTEDLYFCKKAVDAGCKILVDTSVLAGHIDKNTGLIFGLPFDSGPVTRARWMASFGSKNGGVGQLLQEGDKITSADFDEKKALDIGAGGTRREWPGYRTYTTDIREGTADYIQDSRFLNLPDNHFDMVASSHHLEHIGRWDQEAVWQQIYRVCKPGGLIEHIVPDIGWAATKIANAEVPDEHVYNVLYGAQEAHGYERNFNTHYFGYTKVIGKALAEKAGFVDVACKNWQDDPSLGYNLIITGRKPDPEGQRPKPDSIVDNTSGKSVEKSDG